jgi:hypothetical protein
MEMFYDPAKTRYFKETLLAVAGQAFDAAGYLLEDNAMHQIRGLARFRKALPMLGNDVHGFVEWQLLAFEQSPLARFQINLIRNQGLAARAATGFIHRDERSLAWVIWHVFNARILPGDDYWWSFHDGAALAHELATAGRFLFGYGIPWLEMRREP